MEALAEDRADLVLRIVDIGSWDSPVAEECDIGALPTLWLFEDGELVTRDTDAVLARLGSLR